MSSFYIRVIEAADWLSTMWLLKAQRLTPSPSFDTTLLYFHQYNSPAILSNSFVPQITVTSR